MTRTIATTELRDKLRKAYKSLDDSLFDECLQNLPAIPAAALCYFADGDQRCCVFGDFRNLQEDPAGLGDTDDEAYRELRDQMKHTDATERHYFVGGSDCDVCGKHIGNPIHFKLT